MRYKDFLTETQLVPMPEIYRAKIVHLPTGTEMMLPKYKEYGLTPKQILDKYCSAMYTKLVGKVKK